MLTRRTLGRSPSLPQLGEDKPYLEILPDVIRGYGLSLTYGAAHASQSLPRLLTLWFDFGTYLHSVRSAKDGVRTSGLPALVHAAGGW